MALPLPAHQSPEQLAAENALLRRLLPMLAMYVNDTGAALVAVCEVAGELPVLPEASRDKLIGLLGGFTARTNRYTVESAPLLQALAILNAGAPANRLTL